MWLAASKVVSSDGIELLGQSFHHVWMSGPEVVGFSNIGFEIEEVAASGRGFDAVRSLAEEDLPFSAP